MARATTDLERKNREKDWQRARCFHRIGCPPDIYGGAIAGGDQPASGFGFPCGCRNPKHDMAESTAAEGLEDFGEALLGGILFGLVGAGLGAGIGALVGLGKGEDVEDWAQDGALWGAAIGGAVGFFGWLALKDYASRQLLRTLPSWVHVENTREAIQPVESETERELEGIIHQSFQTWTDMPLFQFHRYFDWNFYVIPDPGYRCVAGEGNWSEKASELVVECEWDTGAFAGVSPTSVGALYAGADLSWPMNGQLVWLAGRWIYDCGHGHESEEWKKLSWSERKRQWQQSERMRAELHPIKAVASARWQAVKFSRNRNHYVPGIRFVFFASRKGGYFDFKDLRVKDYEFVVDLPRLPSQDAMDFEIVDAEAYPGCKIIKARGRGRHAVPPPGEGEAQVHLRPTELLLRISTEPFKHDGFGRMANITPIVEPFQKDGGDGDFPTQMKVTIPLSQAGPDDDCFGVHIDLGWLDDAQWTQARQVRECTVTFHSLRKLDAFHDSGGSEQWRMRLGVNGQWTQTPETELEAGCRMSLGDASFTVYLGPDDPLTVCVHGTEHDVVENIFRWSDDDRTIKLDGAPIDYQQDIIRGSPSRVRRISRKVLGMMMHTFQDTSDALGRIHKEYRPTEFALGRSHRKDENAIVLKADTKLAETVPDPAGTNDYTVSYSIEVKRQRIRQG